jgi:hypothetical protein
MKDYKHLLDEAVQLKTDGTHRRQAYYRGKYIREMISVGVLIALMVFII